MSIRSSVLLGITVTLVSHLSAQNLSDVLPAATRIDVRQGQAWRRGAVSEDRGPGSATIKVRLDPNGEFTEVPRSSIRIAPRPASIKVGDRLEWNGQSATSFRFVAATVKAVGTGPAAGMYLMATDQDPEHPTYTKPAQLWMLPEHAGAAAPDRGPAMGKYRCFVYNDKGVPSLLGHLELRDGGTYLENGKPGRYSYSSDTQAVTWASGPAKEQGWLGKMEGNAQVRIRSNVLCSHE